MDGDQELERAVKRRYTLFDLSAPMPHVWTHEAGLGKGVDSVLDPPGLAHARFAPL